MAAIEQKPQAGIPWLARMVTVAPKQRSFIPYDIALQLDPGRSDFAHLRLPDDLTTAEAERLCGVIRAVAMDDKLLTEGSGDDG
jgi:hypothetical protein